MWITGDLYTVIHSHVYALYAALRVGVTLLCFRRGDILDAPDNKWEVAAEELCAVREQIRALKQREEDIVSVFKSFGPGVYAGSRFSIVVNEFTRAVVDLDTLRGFHPKLVEEYTEYRTYMQVRAAPITVQK